MDQLARILLHMQLVDADGLGAGGGADVDSAVMADGQVELGDLIGLWQVGVEVVFPVEPAAAGDGAVQGQSGLDGEFQHRLVQHGQRAGHAGAHRAAVGVGIAAEFSGAAAEDLRGGGQFHMGLQADHGFPGHCASPPFCAAWPGRGGVRLW